MKRSFSSSSLAPQPLGLSFGFNPTQERGGWRQLLTRPHLLTKVGGARGCNWPGTHAHSVVSRTRQQWLGHTHLLWQESSKCPQSQGLEFGERGHDGGPAFCVLLNNGTLLPWQSVLPLRAFRGRVFLSVELLTPIPSGCLHAACSSLFPRFTLQTPRFNTQSTPPMADTHLRLEHTRLWHGPSV